MFFSGLYSESYFKDHRDEFISSASSFVSLNACILARLYAIVVLTSLFFNYLIGKYGMIRSWMASRRGFSALRPILSTIILPRISEWHVILSPILLPSRDMNIEVDVLTKSGTLYQGALRDKILAADGSLQSLTISNPRRFKRDQYLEDIKLSPTIRPEDYWKPIPGNLFVIVANDITTLNVRHIPATVRRFGQEFREIADAIKLIQTKVQTIQRTKEAEGQSASTEPGN